jgi:hypothetical protein
MTDESKARELDPLPDEKNSRRFLGDLEAIWPGASRSREILDRLQQNPGTVRGVARMLTHGDGIGEDIVGYNASSGCFEFE